MGNSPVRSLCLGTSLAGLLLTGSFLHAANLTLEWNDNSDNELGFRIERARFGEGFTEIAKVPADSVRYTDRTAESNTVYLYRVCAYNDAGNSEYSNVASNGPFPLPPGAPSRLANFSIRALAGTGAETLILGFVVAGSDSKPLLVRGIGPGLTAFGLVNALADPQLAIHSGTRLVATNDDWAQADAPQIALVAAGLGAFPLPASSRDSAVLVRLSPGAGTAQLTGKGDTRGIALVELYDAEVTAAAQVVNISARTLVGTGDQTPIIGFSIAGQGPLRVLVRAIGPTLAGFGVGGVAENPRLALFRSGQPSALLENDDWGGTAPLRALFDAVGAFGLPDSSLDAAAAIELLPGSYTAHVSSSSGTTGVALLELYELPK